MPMVGMLSLIMLISALHPASGKDLMRTEFKHDLEIDAKAKLLVEEAHSLKPYPHCDGRCQTHPTADNSCSGADGFFDSDTTADVADFTKLFDCVDWVLTKCMNSIAVKFVSWKTGRCEWSKSCDCIKDDTACDNSPGGYSSVQVGVLVGL